LRPARSLSFDVEPWEAAYLRFESPEEEIRKFTRRLRRLGADRWPRDAQILELFCGRGNGLAALELLGFRRIRGIDLSPRLIRMYRGRARSFVGDCRALPVRAASQDIALVQGGLHHLPNLPHDLERVVAEVHRILKPAGLFAVVEPWLTPFLQLVHRGCMGPARRVSSKLDALATMIEHEGDTYRSWLGQPELVSSLLSAAFEPRIDERRWGKLLFLGRKRGS
jgi:SAM-dependent methyltransferase